MIEPVQLPCKHVFCRECLYNFFTFQNKMECPLCRAVPPIDTFQLEVNEVLQNKIRELAPEPFAQRETELREQNRLWGDFTNLKVTFGNRHKLINDNPQNLGNGIVNRHEWTMFVKFEDISLDPNKIIEKVRYGLHPTFGREYMDIQPNPDGVFEMKFIGWGTFMIPIKVFFREEIKQGLLNNQQTLEMQHYLCFDGDGLWKTIILPMKKDIIQQCKFP